MDNIRNIGISRYYVLRDDMLGYYVNDIAERLAARRESDGWQVSRLFRFVSIQSNSGFQQ